MALYVMWQGWFTINPVKDHQAPWGFAAQADKAY